MAISPPRAFALGACSILLVAGVFVAGLAIGSGSTDSTPASDATTVARRIECPAAPGFTATRAANDRISSCEDAARIQAMLLASGATAANVSVRREASDTLLGPETHAVVIAQVFLPDDVRTGWDADGAALAISRAVGTSIRNVVISDAGLVTLFDGSRTGGSRAPIGAAVLPAPTPPR